MDYTDMNRSFIPNDAVWSHDLRRSTDTIVEMLRNEGIDTCYVGENSDTEYNAVEAVFRTETGIYYLDQSEVKDLDVFDPSIQYHISYVEGKWNLYALIHTQMRPRRLNVDKDRQYEIIKKRLVEEVGCYQDPFNEEANTWVVNLDEVSKQIYEPEELKSLYMMLRTKAITAIRILHSNSKAQPRLSCHSRRAEVYLKYSDPIIRIIEIL